MATLGTQGTRRR